MIDFVAVAVITVIDPFITVIDAGLQRVTEAGEACCPKGTLITEMEQQITVIRLQ